MFRMFGVRALTSRLTSRSARSFGKSYRLLPNKSRSSNSLSTPRLSLWHTDQLLLVGALATSVAFASAGEGECSKKNINKKKEKLFGKRIARVKALKALFSALDLDHGGTITLLELQQFLAANDAREDKSVSVYTMAETIIKRADVDNEGDGEDEDGDRMLSFKEFSAFIMTLLGGIFNMIDVDKSGRVDGEEIQSLLKLMYGDDYMTRLLQNPQLGLHKATKAVYEELTDLSGASKPKKPTSFDQMAFMDFILHTVVSAEKIDGPCLTRLLCMVMSDDEWTNHRQAAKKRIKYMFNDMGSIEQLESKRKS